MLADRPSSSSSALWRAVVLTCLAGAAIAYLWFVRKNGAPYASNADASCYLNEARQFLAGNLKVPIRPIEGITSPTWDTENQRPLGFRLIDRNTMILIGAPGYPLHLYVASWFVGLDWAAVPVNVFAAGAAGLLLLRLCRDAGLPWSWSLAGVAVLWLCPVFVFQELQPMTDVLSVCWYLAAIVAAWRARERAGWAVAAGFAVGVAVLVRPANLLILLPIATLLGFRWRSWAFLVVGGTPAGLFQAWYNLTLFDHLLTTGYGDIGENFGARFIVSNTQYLGGELFANLGPVVLVLAMLALCRARGPDRVARLLWVWIAAVVGFHLTCRYSGLWGSIRYFLPAFPAVIIAALLATRELVQRLAAPRWQTGVALVLLGLTTGWEGEMCRRRDVTIMKRGEVIYVQITEWMRHNAPPDALVVGMQATGALYHYTRFDLFRYDVMSAPDRDRFYAGARATQRPVYAVLFEPERADAMTRLGGEWQKLTQIGAMTAWRLVHAPAPAR